MPATWVDRLLPGERIIWEGAPPTGFIFRWYDVPMTLFGLLFLAISLVFVVSFFPFGILIPHFWVGVYFSFGHFWVERKMRESTSYALTDSRALIVRRWPLQRLSTVNLHTLAEIGLAEHRDGTGTVTFGGQPSMFGQLDGRHRPLPSFERIPDAHHVLALVHRPPPPPPPRPGGALHG